MSATYTTLEPESSASSQSDLESSSYFRVGLMDFYGSDVVMFDMRSMGRLLAVMFLCGGLAMYHTATLHVNLANGALRNPGSMTAPYAIFLTFLSGLLSMWLSCYLACVVNGIYLFEYRYKRRGPPGGASSSEGKKST